MDSIVPDLRVLPANQQPVREDADYVLYWMTAARRTRSSFALDRAIDHAQHLGLPLMCLEALRAGHEWANDRSHAFVMAGMADNREAFTNVDIACHAYVEPKPGAGKGLMARLAEGAAVIVTDDYPCYFLPRMLESFASSTDVLVEAIDGNGLLPMRAAEKTFARAHDFRRFLNRELPRHEDDEPSKHPLRRVQNLDTTGVPDDVQERWPEASDELLQGDADALAELDIDHSVPPSPVLQGGSKAARERLKGFVTDDLDGYGEDRNHPDTDVSSHLSPWLHFGHVGSHEIVAELPTDSPGFESFFDQVVTWRELGFNRCHREADHDRFEALPDWARRTLAEHASDKRESVYSLKQLDTADTHDEIWNAAQRELVTHGRMHNYLRMLWGKKILEWSPSPQAAFERMVELNNRYALDGRDPNSWSGILWCLGLYDRAWGPERPIFGKIRYMSSDNTRRKLKLKRYLEEFGPSSRTS